MGCDQIAKVKEKVQLAQLYLASHQIKLCPGKAIK